jgi:exodeoxyribonuclease VII small subunit
MAEKVGRTIRSHAMSDAQTAIESLSFEKALAELETIVGHLERGDVPLEESIKIYERGEALKKHCEALLKQAEAKVEKIRTGANGQATGTEPLDVD